MPDDILAKICHDKAQHVATQKQQIPLSILEENLKTQTPPRGFKKALDRSVSSRKIAAIAEIKKASPSAGIIRKDFNPADLAASYQSGGATCLSVLTDTPYFQGEDAFIAAVKEASSLPVLRKDFMIDPYQITESRALGADCILLIMAALDDIQAKELEACAHELGMDVLIEVHNHAELERALTLSSRLIGINNRDLKTLTIDLSTSEFLCTFIPKDYTLVCESGIHTHADIFRMQQSDMHCFLIGESLMRQPDCGAALSALIHC